MSASRVTELEEKISGVQNDMIAVKAKHAEEIETVRASAHELMSASSNDKEQAIIAEQTAERARVVAEVRDACMLNRR